MQKRPIAASVGMALLLAETLVLPERVIAQAASANMVRTIMVGSGAAQDVIAAPNETVELYFADGTAVTLSSGARARIGRFMWDANAGSGVLEFALLAGLARISTGRLDARNGLHLRAASADIRLTDAIAVVDLRMTEPTVALWAVGSPAGGADISVNGQTRRIERPGFAVALNAGGPGDVHRYPVAASRDVAEALNPGLSGGRGGASARVDAGNAEGNARDIRSGAQLAAIQLPVDLGPAASRSSAAQIARGTAPTVLASAEPIFEADPASINNQVLTRSVASQVVAQGVDPSLVNGRGCSDGAAPIACDPQGLNNLFFEFDQQPVAPDPVQSLQETLRPRGATSSLIIDARSGSTNTNRLAGPDDMPSNSVYTFFGGQFTTLNGGKYTTWLSVISADEPITGVAFGDDDQSVSEQAKQNPNVGLNSNQPLGTLAFTLARLADGSGAPLSFGPLTDGRLFSGLVPETFLTKDPPDPLDPFDLSNKLESTPFGNGRVSMMQAGFRGFRGSSTKSGRNDIVLVDRLPANFLAIQVDELSSGALLSDCATTPGKTCTGAAYFFAAGDVDARPASDRASVDQFYFTPGLTGYGQTSAAAPTRAFFGSDNLPGSLGPEDAIGYVITPATGDIARFAHADFLYKVENSRVTGLALGAGIGDLTYTDISAGAPEPARRQLAPALGRAVGSSDGNGANAVLYTSTLIVTASGGGNPDLKLVGADDHATTAPSQGRAGYFVVDAQAPGATTSLVRLGQGIATQGAADLDRSGGTFNGYVAGIAQMAAGQVSWLDVRDSDGLSLVIADGVVTATIVPRTLDDTPIGTFTVGGTANSAFVSKDRFLALTPAGSAGSLAIVSSDFLGPFQGAGDPIAAFDAAVPEYARWGAFLGDLTPTPGAQVAAFAPWVAAPRVPQAALPQTGSATYSGAVLGNVAVPSGAQTQSYTAGGTFSHQWSFADRRGNFAMQFDTRNYVSSTSASANGFEFNGALQRDVRTKQVGTVTGAFVSAGPGAGIPAATVGQFSVNEGSTYVAAGVFAGRVSP